MPCVICSRQVTLNSIKKILPERVGRREKMGNVFATIFGSVWHAAPKLPLSGNATSSITSTVLQHILENVLWAWEILRSDDRLERGGQKRSCKFENDAVKYLKRTIEWQKEFQRWGNWKRATEVWMQMAEGSLGAYPRFLWNVLLSRISLRTTGCGFNIHVFTCAVCAEPFADPFDFRPSPSTFRGKQPSIYVA